MDGADTAMMQVPEPDGGGPGRGSRQVVAIAIIAVVAVAAIVAAILVLGGNDGDDEVGILLEPIGQVQVDDFAGNLDLQRTGTSLAIALGDIPPLGSGIASALAGRQASGNQPGLFGGSRDTAVCNVDQLVAFLTDPDNAAKASAWADTLGIEVDEIENYIRDLTAVRLRFDTRVTNHGFRDGRSTPFQSILEAGTAVLVDKQGVPRVKCNCGNPLVEPAPLGDVSRDDAHDVEELAENPEAAWDGFDPAEVVTVDDEGEVEAVEGTQVFVLAALEDGALFARPVGTNGDADTDVPPELLEAICEDLAASPTCEGLVTTLVVPDLVSLTVEDARQALADLGFTGQIEERQEESEEVGEGLLIRTDPPAGAEIPLDGVLTFIVSSGPPEEETTTTTTTVPTAVVPEVAGRSESVATQLLERAGFAVATTTEPSSEIEAGVVIRSTPAGGQRAPEGSTVTLVVSTGPDRVTVPNLVGDDLSDAVAELERLGLVASADDSDCIPQNPCRVFAQDPGPGTEVPVGSTVNVAAASPVVD